jgi:hypothetical protein
VANVDCFCSVVTDDPTSLQIEGPDRGMVLNVDPIRITELVPIIDANLCHDTFLNSRRKRKIMIKKLDKKTWRSDRGTRKPFPQR